MATSHPRALHIAIIATLITTQVFIFETEAAGVCGRVPLRAAAVSMSPCLGAASSVRAPAPPACCAKVAALIHTAPRCLCAVLLSPLAIKAGIKPGIAVSIPKRCNIRNRPAGKKCGRYIVP